MNKQVKITDVKKAINDTTNNIIILALYRLDAQCREAKHKGYIHLYERYNREWNKLFDLLDNVDYFDDCK